MKKAESDEGQGAVDPSYSSGMYFQDACRHAEDAEFKVRCFLDVFLPLARQSGWQIESYIDVGCGSGTVTRMLSKSLRDAGFNLAHVTGYDVSPHVRDFDSDGVRFVHGDFSACDANGDLITLFDVFEHVVDPVGFIRAVASRGRVVGLHIPLDSSLNNALRDKFRVLLRDPGHLIFMDTAFALNLLAMGGLRVVAYQYSLGFLAPSGHRSFLSKIALPLRALLAKISPWLLSKTFGGVSLTVIALTERGLADNRARIGEVAALVQERPVA